MTLDDFTREQDDATAIQMGVARVEKMISEGVPEDKKDEAIQALFKLAKEVTGHYLELARMYEQANKLINVLIDDGASGDEYESRSVN